MPNKRRMTPEEFEVARVRLQGRINPNRLEAARLTLVDGLTMQSVAERFNWGGRQAVYSVVAVVIAELDAFRRQIDIYRG